MSGTLGNGDAPLLGRDHEQSLLNSVLDEVATRGQALVVRGEPGIGKSRLLPDTARAARGRGISVLTATGVQSEAHLPFAGLHQLLRPVRGRAAELPAVQLAALDAAFVLTREVGPEHYRIAMAARSTSSPRLPPMPRCYWSSRTRSGSTARLERAFAVRVSDLPDATRLVLLVAALNDGDAVSETLEAGSAIAAGTLDLDVAAPAVEAGIIDLDLQTLRFRHPLIRSAVVQSAGLGEPRRVHEALANVLVTEPDRRAWHRAALLSGEHEDIALELEEAGMRAQRQGAVAVAVTAMRRAAELSEPASRSRRLLAAAGLAVELGQSDVVVALLCEVNQLDLGDLERARVTWVEETALTRPLGDVGSRH